MSDPVTAAVRRAIDTGLVTPDCLLIVGVSGGPDSAALLVALRTAGIPVIAAHLNHRLRGEASDRDEAAVRQMAARWGIPCVVQQLEADALTGGNIEERARTARYAFLGQTARASGASAIAVGHTADDQLETFFVRLLRGAGPHGLSGIAPRARLDRLTGAEIPVVRPLLDVPREATLAYCRAHGIEPVVDETNVSTQFLRNRLRHRVIPLFIAENPRFRETVVAAMGLVREQQALIRTEVEGRWSEIAVGGATSLRRDVIADWPVALASEALRQAAERLAGPPSPLEQRHLIRLREMAQTGRPRRLHLPGSLEAVVAGPVLRLRRRDAVPVLPEPVALVVPGAVRFGPWEVRAERRVATEVRETSGPLGVWVRSAGPFIVRARRPADRFRPLGGAGTVRVQDELVNRKVPRDERDLLPVITVGERLVWLVGSRVSAEEAVVEGELATRLEARRDT